MPRRKSSKTIHPKKTGDDAEAKALAEIQRAVARAKKREPLSASESDSESDSSSISDSDSEPEVRSKKNRKSCRGGGSSVKTSNNTVSDAKSELTEIKSEIKEMTAVGAPKRAIDEYKKYAADLAAMIKASNDRMDRFERTMLAQQRSMGSAYDQRARKLADLSNTKQHLLMKF